LEEERKTFLLGEEGEIDDDDKHMMKRKIKMMNKLMKMEMMRIMEKSFAEDVREEKELKRNNA
jgi:hypothetical protein